MNGEAPITREDGVGKRSVESEPWFATFMFLDVGCAIHSSQLRGILASIAKLWRRLSSARGRSDA